jgi:hypothetical protein
MPLKNDEARKLYNKEYYQANKEKLKCEHNRIKSSCKECGGYGICEHNKRKTICKECCGSSICEHKRIKYECKECCGSSICEHNKIKSKCKNCGGSGICEHNRRKYRCKDCSGSEICEHNRLKCQCKDCLSVSEYLILLQRRHLNRVIKNINITKTKPSFEYLGCSPEYFKEFIEKKMSPDMNWDNIHLDHIKPVSKFNLEDMDEFLNCCHYSNFQPLLSCDNLRKSNKWNEDDEIFWNENIKGKEFIEIYKN